MLPDPACIVFSSPQALAMIADIRAAFEDLLDEVPWIDDSTRTVATEKVIEIELRYHKSFYS